MRAKPDLTGRWATSLGLTVAVLVGAVIAAQALARPRFYEARSGVDLGRGRGDASLSTSAVLGALREGALGAAAAGKLIPELPPEAAALAVAERVRFDMSDGRTTSITCTERGPDLARALCEGVTRLVAEQAPQVLAAQAASSCDKSIAGPTRGLVQLAQQNPGLIAASAPAPAAGVQDAWREQVRQTSAGVAAEAACTGAPLAALVIAPVVGRIVGPERTRSIAGGVVLALVSALLVGLTHARRRAPQPGPRHPEETAALSGPATSPRPTSEPPGPLAEAAPPNRGAPGNTVPSTGPPPPMPQAASYPPTSSAPPPYVSTMPARSSDPIEPHRIVVPRAPAVPNVGTGFAGVEPRTEPMYGAPKSPAPASPSPSSPPMRSLEIDDLDRTSSPPQVPVKRTTQVLGSPSPPPIVASAASRPSTPALDGRTLLGSPPSGRYSFVSTPPPPGGTPVKPHDLGGDWAPDPRLEAAPTRALSRELFAFGVEHCFTVAVSCLPGLENERAELTASLALALTAPGQARVLLIDADFKSLLQHQLLHARMPEGCGFARQLEAHLMGQAREHWDVLRCTKSLHALVDTPPQSAGLILSRSFETCLRGLRAYYDFILLDGPSGDREAECQALDGVADGVVVLFTQERRAEIPETSRHFTPKRFSKSVRVDQL